jgi:PTH2 family peptidyl-tRNA hydrolase
MDRQAKQVIVMRKDLLMRKGKMIAQGAHASLAVLLDRGERNDDADLLAIALTPAMTDWLGGRFTKVCVSVDSEAALDQVVARAKAAGVPCALIVDSGRTEFHGVPTKTCCAVGPAWQDEVDAITGELPLL